MQRKQRAQRNTLTSSQMYGYGMDARGMQEGKGIFDAIGKFLKKTKIISTIGKIAGPLISILPIPGAAPAGAAVTAAGAVASQLGVGLPRKIKPLSATQMESLKMGLGRPLSSGGISLAMAKKYYPAVKNISAVQMKAVAAYRARHMKGGGVSLAGGRASGYKGMGYSGSGVKLAGTGMHKVGRPKKMYRGGQKFQAQVCPPACPHGYPKGRGVSLAGGQLKIAPFLRAVAMSPAVKKKLAAARKRAAARKKAVGRGAPRYRY